MRSSLLACFALSGCIPGISPTHPYVDGVGYTNQGYTPVGKEPHSVQREVTVPDGRGRTTREMRWFVESPPQQGDQKLQGADYCRNLESNARMNALRHDALGYVLAALGAGSAGTGVVLLATEPDDHVGKNRKALDLGLPILGAVLYAFAAGEFSRAKDANDLASTAAAAETSDKDDIKKNDLCLTAHAAWDNSRSASSAIVEKLTQATKPTDAEVKAKEEKARAEADEAKAKAKKAEAEQQKAEAEAAKAKR